MNILVVEDNYIRIQQFQELQLFHDIVICSQAREAISYVNKQKFDIIFLDHDLGNKVFVNSDDENTRYQVAKAVINSTYNRDAHVVIHSWNSVGAKNIQSILPRSVYIPFGTLEFQSIQLTLKNK